MCKNKEKTEIWGKERNINLGEREKGKIQDTRERRWRKGGGREMVRYIDCTVSKSLQMLDSLATA